MMKKNIFVSLAILLSSYSFAESFKDTLFDKQWGMVNSGQTVLRATSEHDRDRIKGEPGVDINWVSLEGKQIPKDREIVVAVLDSGIDLDHPDLKGRIWFDKKRCEGLNEEERKSQPCHGWNFLETNAIVEDKIGHGTHVAGIIAANINNIGIAGVAHPQVKIMPLKILSPEVNGFVYKNSKEEEKVVTDIIANAIGFAIKNGADIINLSLGWPKAVETPKIKNAIKKAMDNNIPIIAASGNNNKDVVVFPCTYKGVICVGAVDNQGKMTQFSNHGGKVDILAPGEFIVSTYPEIVESRSLRIASYEAIDGSSQAAPFVSAIAASIKLLDPNISLDKLKAKLFNSARPLHKSESKLANFGLVDMKKAIEETPEVMILPDFKNVLNVTYDFERMTFSAKVPIRNYLGPISNVAVSFSVDSKNLVLKKKNFSFARFGKGEEKVIEIEGQIIDKNVDNTAELSVKITAGKKYKTTKNTAIVFARNLDLDKNKRVKTKKIIEVKPEHISEFRGRSKRLLMGTVSDKFNLNGNPEYYFLNRGKQTKEKMVLSLLRVTEKGTSTADLSFARQGEFLGVIRSDVNLDGKPDYVVYNKSQDEESTVFSFFSHDFKPLFGKNSQWRLPIYIEEEEDVFNGVPFEYGKEKFQWVKRKSPLFGEILVPAFQSHWLMPNADNTNDILDRIHTKGNFFYYLDPVIKGDEVILSIRTLDSFSFREKIEADLGIRVPKETYSLQKPFFQNEEDARNGIVRSLLSVGQGFDKQYFLVEFSDTKKWTVIPFPRTHSYLENNNMFPVIDLENQLKQTGDTKFMVILDRITTRLSLVSPKPDKGEVSSRVIENPTWEDVFFTHTASFTGDNKATFLESRHDIMSVLENGEVSRLPINRESSFPGVEFSETHSPVSVQDSNGSHHPGLYINSTLVFGDRLYTMTQTKNGFIRPLSLSINIPKNCINLDPTRLGDKGLFHYTMLCRGKNKQMSLRFLPLELN